MPTDHRELRKLVQLMNENGLVELELEREGERIHLRKVGSASAPTAVHLQAPAPAPLLAAAAPAAAPAPAAPPAAPAGPPPGTKDIRSPMVGTFYRRASPESAPYVQVGDSVGTETVVCILEAMKVNNEIKAELSGQIVEIFVEDGQPVEFDQPMFRVKVV